MHIRERCSNLGESVTPRNSQTQLMVHRKLSQNVRPCESQPSQPKTRFGPSAESQGASRRRIGAGASIGRMGRTGQLSGETINARARVSMQRVRAVRSSPPCQMPGRSGGRPRVEGIHSVGPRSRRQAWRGRIRAPCIAVVSRLPNCHAEEKSRSVS